jgi:hypothetical protein
MSQKIICLLIIAALLLSIVPVIAPAGPQPASSTSVSSGGGGGGSSLTLDRFKNYLERWEKEDPIKYDLVKKLLYKEPWTKINYSVPRVNIVYNRSRLNITRNDEVKIIAYVENPNSEEIRRALYLRLESKEPDETDFKPIGLRQIVQVNEYSTSGKTNYTAIDFPDSTSFHYLKRVGKVELRISVSDGKYKYTSQDCGSNPDKGYFSLLSLNVGNIPPLINNSTMRVTPNATWDGFVEYRASLNGTKWGFATSDSKRSTINATLHIYDKNDGIERLNLSKTFPEGDEIIFNSKDASFFTEKDAGKNFTYRISVSDGIIGGINTTWSDIGEGPRLKRTAKIIVIEPAGNDTEDSSNSWWHKYSFSIKVKSKDPDVKNVQVTLYTDTPDHQEQKVDSPENPETLPVNTDNYTTFEFNDMKPFDVMDCNKNFSYYFTYDVEDANGNRQTDLVDGGRISAKAISYAFESFSGLGNLLLILLFSLGSGVLIEKIFFRRGG